MCEVFMICDQNLLDAIKLGGGVGNGGNAMPGDKHMNGRAQTLRRLDGPGGGIQQGGIVMFGEN
jgi:hypothetical protein